MYVPAHFEASDRGFCHEVMRAAPFAPIVSITAAGELLASHLPWLLDADRGALGTLVGHVSRASPHHDELARATTVLVVFTGPHAYVSPTWYATHPAVPTWNYCAVHASGTPRFLDDDATRDYLARLAAHYEGPGDGAWRFDALPADYQAKMVRGIVAFELEITALQGKAKLSQNRSPVDRANVIAALAASATPGDTDVARWMQRSAAAPVDDGTPSGR